MILNALNYLIILIVTIAASIFCHEYGHILVLKKLGYKYKTNYSLKPLNFKITCTDPFITRKQNIQVLINGILVGMIPMGFLMFVNYNMLLSINILLIYLTFCYRDIKEIINLVKQ